MNKRPRPNTVIAMWDELKLRRIVRVAGMYAVAGWIVTEVTSAIAPNLNLPDGILRTASSDAEVRHLLYDAGSADQGRQARTGVCQNASRTTTIGAPENNRRASHERRS